MPINITMPALSPTMEEGNLAKWLVKEGDSVSAGDVIAEIETDKATMEVEAVDEGTVAKILIAEGSEGVKVNAVIAILAEEGEDVSAVSTASVEAPAQSASAPQDEVSVAGLESEKSTSHIELQSKSASNEEAVKASPLARRVAAQEGIELANIAGSGAHGKVILADVQNATGGSVGSAPGDDAAKGARVFASPLARKMAKDEGIDIALVDGTGPNDRIIAENVKEFIVSGRPTAATVGQPAGDMQKVGTSEVLALFEEGSYELLPHDAMRRIIAERLTESSQTIPSYFITMECELDGLLALRSQINAAAPMVDEKPVFKTSVNDFMVKVMAMALQRVPMANASWSADNRILHKHSDVGVAVAVPGGLFTPIVRKAETKTLSQISAEVKDMAGRARNKKLMPHEYQGGSTAVSNLGMFGVDNFTSIINPPHASIVSIGAGIQKPIVKNGEIKVATIMSATFAFDHRVIDGVLGAELASSFKELIEKPAGMLA